MEVEICKNEEGSWSAHFPEIGMDHVVTSLDRGECVILANAIALGIEGVAQGIQMSRIAEARRVEMPYQPLPRHKLLNIAARVSNIAILDPNAFFQIDPASLAREHIIQA